MKSSTTNGSTQKGKGRITIPKTYEPVARVDFTLNEQDTGDCLRVSKLSPNVHLDWSLYSSSGNFPVRRGIIGDFTNFTTLTEQTSKTYNDPVLENTTSYWYDIRNKSLTDSLYFYHSDHLGTPIAMTDTSATLVWRAEHLPFGGIYALSVSTISNTLRFPGQYFDSETGLSQNWFRDYDAKVGRYREVDILDLKETESKSYLELGPYLYSLNNPVNEIDPSGLSVWVCNRKVRFHIGKVPLRVGNHAYFYDDRDSSCCGRSNRKQCKEKGPKGGDTCKIIEGSAGKEDILMNCCRSSADQGPWIPPFNDCHTALHDCCKAAGLKYPGAPGGRVGRPCEPCIQNDTPSPPPSLGSKGGQ